MGGFASTFLPLDPDRGEQRLQKERNTPQMAELENKYVMGELMGQRLENDFTYHAPHDDQAQRYEALRAAGKVFAETIVGLTPPSREASLALTNVDQAVMFANAAIARNE